MIGDELKDRARTLLEGNIVQNNEYFYTCPSLGTYQHQWLWDSCFHAIAWVYFSPENAKKELICLTKKQFDNGMLPHMIYWKKASGLIPRLGDWLFKRLWPDKDRSHITQSPVIAQAVLAVYEKTKDKNFLEQMITPLQNYYDWLDLERNKRMTDDGLVSVIHPWETGMDLLPIWDHVHKIKRLFTLRSGLWLSKLAKEYNKVNWDVEKIKELNLFLVKDVSFNVIYILNLFCLADLCEVLGLEEAKDLYHTRANQAQKSLEEKCWDEASGFFYSISSLDSEFYPELTVSGLFPLCLDVAKEKLERLVVEHLLNEEEFWLPYPIPCVAKSSPKFNPTGSAMVLWRGPTWFNTNWYIVKGLQRHGFEDHANHIVSKMREMVDIAGFREQYNPFTAKGYGAKNFGWSTLLVDLL